VTDNYFILRYMRCGKKKGNNSINADLKSGEKYWFHSLNKAQAVYVVIGQSWNHTLKAITW